MSRLVPEFAVQALTRTARAEQLYQFKPVVRRVHATERLASVGGDPVGLATAINTEGQAVGTTGKCCAGTCHESDQ